MKKYTRAPHKTMVIGHKNPDADSVCSAIAYAELKNLINNSDCYVPYCAGDINRETEYLLAKYNTPAPRFCIDVRAQVQDIEIRAEAGISDNITLRQAWELMHTHELTTLTVTDDNGYMQGVISLKDVAMANIQSLDPHALADSATPFANIVQTLNGSLLTGDPQASMTQGKVVVAAGSPEVMETMIERGDLVMLANRYETQLCAIEMEAACLVVCMGQSITKTIIKLAAAHNCTVISTPYDSYTAACLINQSIPIKYYMMRDNIYTFRLSTSVDEVKKVMGQVRFDYFPVLDAKSRYVGMISRRNLINLQRKKLILVDHNEQAQCVDGWQEADILEVIDHHRLGTLETLNPVFFRNQPVGCTATIIYQMYREQGFTPTADIAGLLCGAILSDTLMFRSPTCTAQDEQAAHELAKLAATDPNELFREMMQAGEDLSGRSPESIFMQDYKSFTNSGVSFGVGQGTFFSWSNMMAARDIMRAYLPEAQRKEKMDMIFYMLTAPKDKVSEILYYGDGAEELLRYSFHSEPENGIFTVPGLLSRKQQLIPALIEALRDR